MNSRRSALAAAGGILVALALLAVRRRATGEAAAAAGPEGSGKVAEAREARLRAKFAPEDGITFFFFPRSPCARRVWLTLLEKGIKFRPVMVNLLAGEQRSNAYLAVNPQGKVPAVVVRNVHGLPDCILYESQAIVEWLEEVPWPEVSAQHYQVLGPWEEAQPIALYPSTPIGRVEVKLWQYWELSLAEEFWPLSRLQVDGVLWRFMYSKQAFDLQLAEWSPGGSDPFYEAKAKAVYAGTYLSDAAVKRSILRIVKGFVMLEGALEEIAAKESNRNGDSGIGPWLVDGNFSQADVAVYPRLVKAPQNGILATTSQRAHFPRTLKLFGALADRRAFAQFKERDQIIWESGTFPRFAALEIGFWARVLPWPVVVALGNWRAGVSFTRRTQDSFAAEVEALLGAQRKKKKASAGATAASGAVAPGGAACATDGDGDGVPRAVPRNVAPLSDPPTLYYSTSLAMSCAVQIMVAELGVPGMIFRRVDTLHCEQLSPSLQALSPFGELPVLVYEGRSIYGPHIIVEFLLDSLKQQGDGESSATAAVTPSPSVDTSVDSAADAGAAKLSHKRAAARAASASLLPSGSTAEAATSRARVRRWFGWVRTAHYYQLHHCWEGLWWGPTLRDVHMDFAVTQGSNAGMGSAPSGGGSSDGGGEEGCGEKRGLASLRAALPADDGDASAALEAFSAAAAGRAAALEKASPYIAELKARVAYVEAELSQSAAAASAGDDVWLCGTASASYADLFVLPVVLLALKYAAQLDHASGSARGGDESDESDHRDVVPGLDAFPRVRTWARALLKRGGDHGWCAKLCGEMLCLHGRPDIKTASSEFGYDYEMVGGLVYNPFTRQDCVSLLRRHYVSKPGDIFVATYPKAGTTWLQTIVLLLLHRGDASKVTPHPLLQKQAPWLDAAFLRGPVKRLAGPRPYLDFHSLEDLSAPFPSGQGGCLPSAEASYPTLATCSGQVDGDACDGDAKCDAKGDFKDDGEKRPQRQTFLRRRVFKTHAPWQLFPVAPRNLHRNTKIVVAARNAKDVAVSLWKHTAAIPAHNYRGGTWEDFFGRFLSGQVCEGSWFDHTVGWWRAYLDGPASDRSDGAADVSPGPPSAELQDHIFWVPFEELKADPSFWIGRLAAFLGVDASPEVIAKVVAASSFETMEGATRATGGDSKEATSRFANGGQAGGWSKQFTAAQSAALDVAYATHVTDASAPGLKFAFGNDPFKT